jgi:hypothetical protein
MLMKDFVLSEEVQEAWAAGRRIGLEQAAFRIEQLGGKYRALLSPDVAAREIRALASKDK